MSSDGRAKERCGRMKESQKIWARAVCLLLLIIGIDGIGLGIALFNTTALITATSLIIIGGLGFYVTDRKDPTGE